MFKFTHTCRPWMDVQRPGTLERNLWFHQTLFLSRFMICVPTSQQKGQVWRILTPPDISQFNLQLRLYMDLNNCTFSFVCQFNTELRTVRFSKIEKASSHWESRYQMPLVNREKRKCCLVWNSTWVSRGIEKLALVPLVNLTFKTWHGERGGMKHQMLLTHIRYCI